MVLSKVPLTRLYPFYLQSILKSLFSNVHEIATMAVLLVLSIIWLYSMITKSSKYMSARISVLSRDAHWCAKFIVARMA